jgi:pyruvate formate lyase activating enzyme
MAAREAMLWEPREAGGVSCSLCAHRCLIKPGKRGVCGVRENREGTLYTLVFGKAVAVHVDPIEKKPLYHFLPGSKALSIATVGCNFRCPFCQNWTISQSPRLEPRDIPGEDFPPEDVVRAALKSRSASISYTYTEPTIFFEYAYETAKLAKKAGLANTFVTNGYMTAEALQAMKGLLDAANVDLKFFRDESYRKVCGARLQPVLDSIRLMKELGVWVEVTTLVVPGLNDGEEELAGIARFLAGLDPGLPWHISRYHPDYEFTEPGPTPVKTLRRAAEIGRREGLDYVYIGNVWGEAEDTNCHACGALLIRREGFAVLENRIRDGRCPDCSTAIPGVF